MIISSILVLALVIALALMQIPVVWIVIAALAAVFLLAIAHVISNSGETFGSYVTGYDDLPPSWEQDEKDEK